MIARRFKTSLAVSIIFHSLMVAACIGFHEARKRVDLQNAVQESATIRLVSFSIEQPGPQSPMNESQDLPVEEVPAYIEPVPAAYAAIPEAVAPEPVPLPEPPKDPPLPSVPKFQPTAPADSSALPTLSSDSASTPVAAAVPAPSESFVSETGSSGAPAGINTGPSYLFTPKPPYPPKARKLKQQGLVLLNVLITSNGFPRQVDLRESSGFALLDSAAAAAIEQWRFQPAEANGQPVDFMAEIPVRFTLR